MKLRSLVESLAVSLCESPDWTHPGVDGDESGEIHRTAHSLGVHPERLKSAVAKGKVAPIHPDHMAALQNTDANSLRGKKDAKRKAAGYGRNIHRIFKGFRKGKKMPAPVILHRKGHDPYLIGGNTRLMAAHAAGIQPHAVHAHLNDEE